MLPIDSQHIGTPDRSAAGSPADAVGGSGEDLAVESSDQPTYWEDVAASRWGRYITAHEEKAIRGAVAAVPGPRTALEIGCEGGRWVHLLSGLGWSVTATDVDKEALDTCARRVPAARCVLVDPSDSRLPLGADSVGLVLCIEVVNVLQSPWFVPELRRVLRPGGMAIVVSWNKFSARGMLANVRSLAVNRVSHRFYQVSYSRFRRQLRAASFEIVQESGMCWFPFGRSSDSRWIPAAIRIEQVLGLSRLPAVSPWVLTIVRSPPSADRLEEHGIDV